MNALSLHGAAKPFLKTTSHAHGAQEISVCDTFKHILLETI